MHSNDQRRICGAKSRQNGGRPCRQLALNEKDRCRLHGGKSTGPKTEYGKLKSATANLKHGLYTQKALQERKMMRTLMKWRNDLGC